jgi:hypothetical protein
MKAKASAGATTSAKDQGRVLRGGERAALLRRQAREETEQGYLPPDDAT